MQAERGAFHDALVVSTGESGDCNWSTNVWFQMAEVAVPRQMFAEILSLIGRLRAPPPAPP